ncbi:UNVERIFIED_CONTAM: COP1-interactive protein 1 [Sesamum radiatum]|uniref:COP1-interactive protein 1 n=1 Tax=Sesamum radiatum TaxID=300843 RepID=A0AAW2L118_SESRA
MARRRWKGSLKPFSNHIDPEKEEQLNWVKIGKQPEPYNFTVDADRGVTILKACLPAQRYPERGCFWYTERQLLVLLLFLSYIVQGKLRSSLFCAETENQVKRILKLTKSLNYGNKERNLKKRLEVVQLIEDFQKQYESLYSLYEDLREKVKIKVGRGEDDCSSAYNSDSEAYYSSGEFNVRRSKFSSYVPKAFGTDYNQDSDSSDLEDTILKDKLTSSSEVKRTMNPDSLSAFGEIVKDLKVQGEEPEKMSQRLDQIKDLEVQVASLKLANSTLYMQKTKLEEHLKYSSDQIVQMNEKMSHRLAQIKDLEGQVASLKLENSTLYMQKRDLEEHLEDSSDLIVQMNEKIAGLEAQVVELAATAKENECLVAQANDMQLQLTIVEHEKDDLEGLLEHESKQRSDQVKALWEQVNSLQQELASVNSQKEELELKLKRKMKETSECLLQIEDLRNELMSNEKGVKDLELEIHTLTSKKSYLEEQVKKINHEVFQSNVEKEKLHGEISGLQIVLSERENELSTELKKFESCQNIMSMKIKSLTEEVEILRVKLDNMQNERNRLEMEFQNEQKQLQMELVREKQESSLSISQVEKMNAELTNKVAYQQKTLLELEAVVRELKDENADAETKLAYCKSNFPVLERKVDEMAEEFRKQCEDKYRMLSRRIRVAEQLQVENKEWYRKTKESYEQENKDLKERLERTENGVKNIKEVTLTANDTLTSLDSMALKFEECTANFLNRISKASCELKFVKDWAMRKNRALVHVKDDLDCLLAQLDDKEAEILVFREKFWKSENKVRELEKMMKEKEDAMLGFKEEKREAIRQLCVWIDYHRARSDYYKKMVSEMNAGRRRAS